MQKLVLCGAPRPPHGSPPSTLDPWAEENERLRSGLSPVTDGRSASGETLREAEQRAEALRDELKALRAELDAARASGTGSGERPPDGQAFARAMSLLDEIRDRAYFFWMEEGRRFDRHLNHWIRAEAEVRELRGLS